jgi:Repeat of unknown function (DUF5648)
MCSSTKVSYHQRVRSPKVKRPGVLRDLKEGRKMWARDVLFILSLFASIILSGCSDPLSSQKTISSVAEIKEKATLPASLEPLVYRFAKYSSGAYFYTGSSLEAQLVIDSYPDFRYEGPAFGHDTTAQGIAVYRFANLNNGGYFFTGSEVERDATIQNYPNMRFEGSTFKSVPVSTEGAQAIHRLANLNNGAYLYTTSVAERDYAVSLGFWRYEGVTFYAPPAAIVIDSFSCTPTAAGNTLECTVAGKNLSSTIQAKATNCAPSTMNLNAAQSSTKLIFSCIASTQGQTTVNLNKVTGGVIGPSLTPAYVGNIYASASLVVTDWVCNYPYIGYEFLCEITGINLPNTFSIKSDACTGGVLAERSGGTSSFRRFSCNASTSGTFQLSYTSLPGISNPFTVRYDRELAGGTATITDFVCDYPRVGNDFTCQITGTNLPNGISVTSNG